MGRRNESLSGLGKKICPTKIRKRRSKRIKENQYDTHGWFKLSGRVFYDLFGSVFIKRIFVTKKMLFRNSNLSAFCIIVYKNLQLYFTNSYIYIFQ